MTNPCYPSGAAALFAGHAREEQPVRFVSTCHLLARGEPLICQGELVEAVEATADTPTYLIKLNGAAEAKFMLPGVWVNTLAGRKVVEE